MDIFAVQQRLIDNGFQFVEHIYNDGNERNCYVAITREKICHFTFENCYTWGGRGWGRFTRHRVWTYVAEWLDEQEFGA